MHKWQRQSIDFLLQTMIYVRPKVSKFVASTKDTRTLQTQIKNFLFLVTGEAAKTNVKCQRIFSLKANLLFLASILLKAG